MKYIDLVRLYQKLESTSKRLDKTYHISRIIEDIPAKDLHEIILLLQGKVFPNYDQRKIGVAAKLVVKSLTVATGYDAARIENEWKKTGDLGDVAGRLITKKKQQTLMSIEITASKVAKNLRKLAEIEGHGSVDSKIKLIAELLTSASDIEAKYIIRTVLETLRVGVGAGAIRDAIVWSCFPKVAGIFHGCPSCKKIVPNAGNCMECGKNLKKSYKDVLKDIKSGEDEIYKKLKILYANDPSELKDVDDYDIIVADDEKSARKIHNYFCDIVQKAYDLTNDFGEVAETAKNKGWGGLLDIGLKVGIPINVMLYPKAKDIDDAFNTVGKPCACEYKYDGFRLQIHRKGDDIKLITRRLEDVTDQFPDVRKAVKKHVKSNEFIIDCEIIGIDRESGRWLPFQSISQRIKRKYEIEDTVRRIPVVVKIFDAMEIDGKNLLDKPFEKRRKEMERITEEEKGVLTLAKEIVTDDEKKADEFYRKSLELGNEGMMMKNLKGPYTPGTRVGHCVKIKPVMESLDLVITDAEWGEGKRSGWLTSFTVACMDEDGGYLEIGKVSTGLKEKKEEGTTFNDMTEKLKPLIIAEKGKKAKIKPEVVIAVHYEEIQKSPNYASGFALRFPRVISVRDDMRADEISTIALVEEIYSMQRGRKSQSEKV